MAKPLRFFALVVCCCLAALARAASGEAETGKPRQHPWRWELSAETYKNLNMVERSFYDKAVAAFKRGDYRAAAAEYEKFKVQLGDTTTEENLAYVNFMYAYCLHHAKDKNAAIKAYQDVVDFFPDQVEWSGAALYFKGAALLEMGETKKGLETMQQMLAKPQFRLHPLAAGAMKRLGDNHMRNKQPDQALALWKEANGYWQCNPQEAQDARNSVIWHYLANQDLASIDNWLLSGAARENPEHRKWVAATVLDVAMGCFDFNRWGQSRKEEHAKAIRAFWDWYKGQRPALEKAGAMWLWFEKGISFLAWRFGDKNERKDAIEAFLVWVKSLADKNDANNKLAWLVDRLCDMGDWTGAEACAAQISDAYWAGWKSYEISARQSKWAEAIAKLENLEKINNPQGQKRAKYERARIYKDVTREYDKAIKLYQELDEPPGTAWAIAECQRGAGRLKEALSTLTEIENSFPDNAARAAWHKARWQEEDGQLNAAVAGYKRILKLYKGTHEASQSHQALERLGIEATGGGEFHED